MSNSFSPKKEPNLLNQDTLERLLVALRQPFSIAVLASLVVHGLLWAALPNFLAETEKEPNTKQRIKTVELSPAEQSQLPQFGINPIPQTLLPTKPVKPSQSGTKLPDPKLYNDPSLYNFPTLEPPPPFVLPSLGLPSPSDFKPPPPAPKTPSPNPSTAKSPAPTPPPVSPSPTIPGNKPPVAPASPGLPDAPSNEQRTALLLRQGKRAKELRSLYTFNGPARGTEVDAFNKGQERFLDEAIKVTGGKDEDKRFNAVERVNGLVPKEACPFISGMRNASLGAIVKPDGTLAEPPTVLLTTGFKGLDNAAIDDVINTVKNKKYGDGSKFQIIRFDFIFDPKTACTASDKPA